MAAWSGVGAAGHDRTTLVAGVVLLALFLVDTAIVFPLMRARRDLRRSGKP